MNGSSISWRDVWAAYVAEVTSGVTQAQVAEWAGVDQSTAGRWLRGVTAPDAKAVVSLARSLDRSPLEALVAAGFIGIEEALAGVDDEVETFLAGLLEQAQSDAWERNLEHAIETVIGIGAQRSEGREDSPIERRILAEARQLAEWADPEGRLAAVLEAIGEGGPSTILDHFMKRAEGDPAVALEMMYAAAPRRADGSAPKSWVQAFKRASQLSVETEIQGLHREAKEVGSDLADTLPTAALDTIDGVDQEPGAPEGE